MHDSEPALLDGEYSEYPGHPLVIAYLISKNYPSLEAALSREGTVDQPAALGDCRIPGAGGNVWSAITLLTRIRDGEVSLEMTIDDADCTWRSDTDNGHKQHFAKGQAQADRIKVKVGEIVAWVKGT